MRTQVAIVGAGPAGMLLSHLLAAEGVDSVVIETRSRDYVLGRIRAGILEHGSVQLLQSVGLGRRLTQEGIEHGGIYLQCEGQRQRFDFVNLVGRSVWVYGQTELQRDLIAARQADGQHIFYEVADATLYDIDTERPYLTFINGAGVPHRLDADAIVGCDGSLGPSRVAVPDGSKQVWERVYPYSWLSVLADVAPSTDELIYAWHSEGFALHSMRSSTVSRLYLQVPNHTNIALWTDQRIWDALARRLGDGIEGWSLRPGPIAERSVLPMRSYVQAPMRYGRLFLAGDAAHILPPTGAKGLNLAIADVALLAPALSALVRRNKPELADAYSLAALRRVWRYTHFSWWMTTMLHTTGDPFDTQLQQSQLQWLYSSDAAAIGLAENYTGLPLTGRDVL
ncbi:4-hydroxybenzoate 3-monooxygenase [Mycobacterium persicum]|nr:4-hydroxybenzoate 3-monooxygenase [Mycobacterium persicum]ORB88144.1 4-hydroxybenzoate 3-monooxygenase [Mycobacterium persicum]